MLKKQWEEPWSHVYCPSQMHEWAGGMSLGKRPTKRPLQHRKMNKRQSTKNKIARVDKADWYDNLIDDSSFLSSTASSLHGVLQSLQKPLSCGLHILYSSLRGRVYNALSSLSFSFLWIIIDNFSLFYFLLSLFIYVHDTHSLHPLLNHLLPNFVCLSFASAANSRV